MSDRHTFILRQLFAAYVNCGATLETIAVYHDDLIHIPADELETVCKQCRHEMKFPPTISEILERHAFLTRKIHQGTAEEEWAKVQHASIQTHRPDVGEIRFRNAITRKVLAMMGGLKAIGKTDKIAVERAQFIRYWEAYAAREEELARLTPAARQLVIKSEAQREIEPVDVLQLPGNGASHVNQN